MIVFIICVLGNDNVQKPSYCETPAAPKHSGTHGDTASLYLNNSESNFSYITDNLEVRNVLQMTSSKRLVVHVDVYSMQPLKQHLALYRLTYAKYIS